MTFAVHAYAKSTPRLTTGPASALHHSYPQQLKRRFTNSESARTLVRHMSPAIPKKTSPPKYRHYTAMAEHDEPQGTSSPSATGISNGIADIAATNDHAGSAWVHELASQEWVCDLARREGMQQVLTAGAMLTERSALPSDHMFSALLGVELVRDMVCMYEQPTQKFHTVVALGSNVCGHRGILHGGMSAMIIDETLGALVYVLKRDGVIGAGPAFTAHLGVDYKAPVPSSSHVICTTTLESVEGRKVWVRAEMRDRPDGVLYSTARALFVIPRQIPVPPRLAPSEAASTGSL